MNTGLNQKDIIKEKTNKRRGKGQKQQKTVVLEVEGERSLKFSGAPRVKAGHQRSKQVHCALCKCK